MAFSDGGGIFLYRTVRILNRWLLAAIGTALLLFVLLPFCMEKLTAPAFHTEVAEQRIVLLDAGHGGVDPGAIGVNGVQEKEINLSIALILRDILRVNGYTVRMTRDSDIALNDPQYTKIAAIKTSDLKNRLKLIEADADTVALSIHQNQFGQAKYHGAQMFYGRNNKESHLLAECLQTAFKSNLQPDNSREIKRSTSDVYIIHHATVPIVLAECGFLSNPAECEQLCDPEYQRQVAFTLYCGLEEFYQKRQLAETESLPE